MSYLVGRNWLFNINGIEELSYILLVSDIKSRDVVCASSLDPAGFGGSRVKTGLNIGSLPDRDAVLLILLAVQKLFCHK